MRTVTLITYGDCANGQSRNCDVDVEVQVLRRPVVLGAICHLPFAIVPLCVPLCVPSYYCEGSVRPAED